MSVKRSWSDVANNAGGQTYDFTDQLADGVRNFACNLWRGFPDKVASRTGIPGAFVRGYMNQGCRDGGTVPPPEPEFSGGQCFTAYRIYGTYTSQSNRIARHVCGEQANWITRDVAGKIVSAKPIPGTFSLTVVLENPAGEKTETLVPMYYSINPGSNPTTNVPFYVETCQNNAILYAGSSPVVVGIIRQDGQPDDCGDPPPVYPKSPDVTINDIQTTVTVNNFDGTTNNISLNVINNFNDLNASISMPMSFSLGGVTVDVDMGGFTFNNSKGNSTFNTTNNNLRDGNRHPLPLPKPDSEPAPEILPPSPENYEEIEKTDEDPKEEEVGVELEFVRVTVTKIPTNVKSQWGDGAPNVYYCGWFEFISDGYAFNRQPIHFLSSLFVPPVGTTGYAYTLYKGFKGFATIYKKKQEET